MNTAETTPPDTIVLIHGLWMTPRSWEGWIRRYEERGFKVLAPSWPGMEADVEALNANPAPIAKLDIRTIVDHYERIIRGLDSEPIIMGHSFGGTFVQLLLGRDIGVAGVGVSSATVKGVPDLPLSTIRATLPVLRNPSNRGKAVPLSPKQFHYAFANTLDRRASDEIHRRYHVPAAGRVLFEGALANLRRHPPTEVDFGKDDRAPMLFIAFENDHVIPPQATRHNAKKYAGARALTAFTEFPGRPHFPAVPGWEEVADAALAWALDPSPEPAKSTSPAAG
jgi:pimeloyl-ACP methyl ester carboxylesterase